jgi:hypothetical protein
MKTINKERRDNAQAIIFENAKNLYPTTEK